MQRHLCAPRTDWVQRVESVGLTYHSHSHAPYWHESAYYEFSAAQIDALERAANELHPLCIAAAEHIITRGDWHRLSIPEAAIPTLLRSWERDDFSLYGRFDFSFDGHTAPKLLEYNADTPTALVEAAVAQWFWLQDVHPKADQFNSIHDRLIAAWKRWAQAESLAASGGSVVHFSSIKDHPEDEQTVLYLRDTALQAGLTTRSVFVEEIGWDAQRLRFVDSESTPMDHCFKLYPWEWLWQETFAPQLERDTTRFIEPAWKMLLSNKGLLPVLWELFPGHPNLLPAYDSLVSNLHNYVKKPKLSREGANIAWHENGKLVEETTGDYGQDGYVYQALAPLPNFSGNHPVCGVWIVDHEAAGLGLREDTSRITGNLSRFVPHLFR